jgi:hypothetical protein
MKRTGLNKLQLSKDTIRELTSRHLGIAHGGRVDLTNLGLCIPLNSDPGDCHHTDFECGSMATCGTFSCP